LFFFQQFCDGAKLAIIDKKVWQNSAISEFWN
jgi:hypothetical protein